MIIAIIMYPIFFSRCYFGSNVFKWLDSNSNFRSHLDSAAILVETFGFAFFPEKFFRKMEMANSICISVTHYHSTITNYHEAASHDKTFPTHSSRKRDLPAKYSVSKRKFNENQTKDSPIITNYHELSHKLIINCHGKFAAKKNKNLPPAIINCRGPLQTRSKSSGRDENAIENSIEIVGSRRECH